MHLPIHAPAGDLGEFTSAWLRNRRLSEHTRVAYQRDVAAWLRWCADHGTDPLTASFLHVNAYARELESIVDSRSGRPMSPATVARRLSGVSSWYDFLVRLGAVVANPVAGADRPRVGRDHSATVGLTAAEVDALLAAAAAEDGPQAARNLAMVTLLADLGLRVGELVGLVDADLAARGDPVDGALFVTATGGRVDRHAMFRLVRRLARAAGIPAWAKLSPHSLRHAFATTARDEGVALEDVQDAMGHADPRTTRRYDRDRHNLDRDPTYAIWAAPARRQA